MKPTVETQFMLVQENPASKASNGPMQVELEIAYASNTSRCTATVYPDGSSQLSIDGSLSGPGLPNLYGAAHRFVFYRDGTTKSCTLDSTTNQTLPDTGPTDSSPRVALHVFNGSAQIFYTIVYGSN